MDSTVWGPKLWFVMHTFALSYPENPSKTDKMAMDEFFNNLKLTIPCPTCRKHYSEILAKNPVSNHLSDRASLFAFTVDVHNEVNKTLDKPLLSVEHAMYIHLQHYDQTKPQTKPQKSTNTMSVCLWLLLIIATIVIIPVLKNFNK